MKSNLKSALLAAAVCLPFFGGGALANPILIGADFPTSKSRSGNFLSQMNRM